MRRSGGGGLSDKMKTGVEEIHSNNKNVESTSLEKDITLSSGIAIIVGQIVGSGIFITPKSILHYAGSFGVSVLMWIFGALVAMAGGLCYIELGLLVKRGGGESGYLIEAYSFKKRSRCSELFGSMLGFLFVWSNVFILRPASLGIQSLTCARYLTQLFYKSDEVPDSLVKAVAFSVLGELASRLVWGPHEMFVYVTNHAETTSIPYRLTKFIETLTLN